MGLTGRYRTWSNPSEKVRVYVDGEEVNRVLSFFSPRARLSVARLASFVTRRVGQESAYLPSTIDGTNTDCFSLTGSFEDFGNCHRELEELRYYLTFYFSSEKGRELQRRGLEKKGIDGDVGGRLDVVGSELGAKDSVSIATVIDSNKFFSAISGLPKTKLCLERVPFSASWGWKRSAVTARICVDSLLHAIQGDHEVVVLLVGDKIYRHLMRALRELGKRVELAYLAKDKIAKSLFMECDLAYCVEDVIYEDGR